MDAPTLFGWGNTLPSMTAGLTRERCGCAVTPDDGFDEPATLFLNDPSKAPYAHST